MVQWRDNDDLLGGKLSCWTAAFQEKQEANLMEIAHVIETKHPFNTMNRIKAVSFRFTV